MKKSLIFIANGIILLIFTIISCNKPAEITPAPAEIFQSVAGTGIGAEIKTTITANGGFVQIGAGKITIPAGAMPVGTVFTSQAIADKLDDIGQGISITGDWTKPITVEFAAPIGEQNPENYKIALRLPNGYWITCTKAKYNSATKTVSVRIAPTPTTGAKSGAKIQAKKYDLAFAKYFFLKPENATIDLGGKQNFVAYTREGFIPVKIGKRTFNAEADLEAAIKQFTEASAALDAEEEDDDLVPLTRQANPAANDDELVSLPAMGAEYKFTNSKADFTRNWKVADGPGTIKASGNIGADYTAPTDEKMKGKTAKIIFTSKNNKTGRNIEAIETIRINDGLTRYKGTITFIEKRNSISGRKAACSPEYITDDTKMISNVIFTSTASGLPNQLLFTTYDDLNAPANQLLNNVTTIVEYSNGYNSDGEVRSRLVGTCGEQGIYAGSFSIILNSQTKTYELRGTLTTKYQLCEKEVFNICSNEWEKSKTSFSKNIPDNTNSNYTDINKLSGSIKNKDIEVIWDFVKQN